MKIDERLDLLIAQREVARFKVATYNKLNSVMRTTESLMMAEGAYMELDLIESVLHTLSGGGI